MKKKFCLIFALVFTLSTLFSPMVSASDRTLFDYNTSSVYTNFSISDTGEAHVIVDYTGFPGVTTGATVRIKIEKRNLLVFWTEVIVDIHYFREASHAETFVYQLEKSGTYRCTVEYLISGTGGADDEIVFQDTATY